MKKVRNYLREVQEAKSKQEWLSFEEKLSFGGWELQSAKRQ